MKDLKISAELASAVLNKEVTKCSLINKARNSINITYFEDKEDFNPICREYNIYEFAFKCKEWAFKRGLNLWTDYLGNCQIQDKDFQLLHDCYSDTEVEAIFLACEYILNNIKQ